MCFFEVLECMKMEKDLGTYPIDIKLYCVNKIKSYTNIWHHILSSFNPLSANFTKWSNTLKQFVGKLPTNCLSVFDHFVGLALKGLKRTDIEYYASAFHLIEVIFSWNSFSLVVMTKQSCKICVCGIFTFTIMTSFAVHLWYKITHLAISLVHKIGQVSYLFDKLKAECLQICKDSKEQTQANEGP